MKRLLGIAAGLLVVALTLGGCHNYNAFSHLERHNWVNLIDGEKGLDNFNRVGDANWRAEGGAIVNHVSVPVPLVYKAGGRWNVMDVRVEGDEITVVLNGVVTAYLKDKSHPQGPFSLQYGAGVKGATGGPIKWRRVDVRELPYAR